MLKVIPLDRLQHKDYLYIYFLVFFDKFSGYNRENKLKSLENIYKFFKIQSLYENVAQKLSAHWDFRINKSLIK